jgi:phosphoribosylformylglycinamidine synthase
MIHFFENQSKTVFCSTNANEISAQDISKLNWFFCRRTYSRKTVLTDFFVGPRAAMVTPWSTNAVEITQNMGISGIIRIEESEKVADLLILIRCYFKNTRNYIKIYLL